MEQLRSLAEGLAVSLENAFHVQLMKLPKKIRTLSMGEFCEKYAGDLQQVYDEQLQRVVQDLAQEEDAAQALSAQRYNTMSRCVLAAPVARAPCTPPRSRARAGCAACAVQECGRPGSCAGGERLQQVQHLE